MRATVLRLAWADYRAEARLSACAVLGLAAVLAPLLVLFGLKFGLVATLTQRLVEDPRTRELIPVGSGRYDAAWFDALRARPEVAFVVPRTRQIAATADLRAGEGHAATVELLPSAASDPLLARYGLAPPAAGAAVLSRTAADKLGLVAGAEFEAVVGRARAGREEAGRIRLKLAAVLPLEGFDRDAAFVPLELLLAAEDFRDGYAVPALGWPGTAKPAGERSFPGFRLYARSLDAVEPLRVYLVGRGLEVLTQADAIANVKALARNLGVVFAVIAGLGAAGYLASAAASSLAAVERKRRDLSILRLLGLGTGGLLAYPLAQALFTGGFGAAAAFAFYAAAATGINLLFAASRGPGEYLCRLLPLHLAVAFVATLAAVLFAALAGGWRATRIEPSEGWREV